MSENKFDLSNIITVDNVKDSYSYKKSKGILKNFFNQQFETEGGYNDENDEEMYCHVVLTHAEYNYLNDLCHLVNINIEDYSPMKYFSPNDDITYSYCLNDLPDRYFNYADFNKLRCRIVKELVNRKLIQFNLKRKTFWVTAEDYFKIISQLSCFIESYVAHKTEAINKLENLFKRRAFYKINDMAKPKIGMNKLKERIEYLIKPKFLSDLKNVFDIAAYKLKAENDLEILFKKNTYHKISDIMQKTVAIDKLKNCVEHLAKLKFLSMLKNTVQTVKNTQAINKLDHFAQKDTLQKINNVHPEQKNLGKENQFLVQGNLEHNDSKRDNKSRKSLRKKLIIGGCITLILSLVILYFNLIAGIVSFAIGVCVLVIYVICKSKANKIQEDPKILLNVPMDKGKTQPLVNSITKGSELNNELNSVSKVTNDPLQNL